MASTTPPMGKARKRTPRSGVSRQVLHGGDTVSAAMQTSPLTAAQPSCVPPMRPACQQSRARDPCPAWKCSCAPWYASLHAAWRGLSGPRGYSVHATRGVGYPSRPLRVAHCDHTPGREGDVVKKPTARLDARAEAHKQFQRSDLPLQIARESWGCTRSHAVDEPTIGISPGSSRSQSALLRATSVALGTTGEGRLSRRGRAAAATIGPMTRPDTHEHTPISNWTVRDRY